MPLPLAVLRATQNQPMMVELKNGDTLSGVLISCDGFMNLHMRDLVCTSRDGDRFWKIPEAYVRGNNVKYLRLPDEVLEIAATTQERPQQGAGAARGRSKSDWQPSGGRGRGRGRGRGTVDLKSRDAKPPGITSGRGRGTKPPQQQQ